MIIKLVKVTASVVVPENMVNEFEAAFRRIAYSAEDKDNAYVTTEHWGTINQRE